MFTIFPPRHVEHVHTGGTAQKEHTREIHLIVSSHISSGCCAAGAAASLRVVHEDIERPNASMTERNEPQRFVAFARFAVKPGLPAFCLWPLQSPSGLSLACTDIAPARPRERHPAPRPRDAPVDERISHSESNMP